MEESTLAMLRPHMGSVRAPGTYDKVYNDECVYSFATPFSPGGLYVSLSNWQGVGANHLAAHSAKTNSRLYLHVVKTKTPKPVTANEPPQPTTLDGLLQASKDENLFDVIEALAVVAVDGETGNVAASVPYPHPDLPMVVADAAAAVHGHASAGTLEEVATSVGEEEVAVSKYAANLPLLENGVKISPDASTWECAESGMKENLWLNLSTGHIGSGRQQWDGSGGKNGALNHFTATGKQYPLVVKLGTITPEGADVYSYAEDEDCLVKDPLLGEHLARWGINIMAVQKTDKTLAELEVELNKAHDFSAITEAGAKLEPVSGPGLTGLVNLGNSCYMNSTLQMLLAPQQHKPLASRFGGDRGAALLAAAPANDPAADVLTQTSKLVGGMLAVDSTAPTGTSGPGAATEPQSVRPQMFKSLVGRGHPEFSTGRQQDAVEYLEHLCEVMARAERGAGGRLAGEALGAAGAEAAEEGSAPPLHVQLGFRVETRLACGASNTVRYSNAPGHLVLRLPIPMDQATNQAEVAEDADTKRARVEGKEAEEKGSDGADSSAVVLPKVPLSACLAAWAADAEVVGFKCPALGGEISPSASKRTRLASFPNLLVLQAQRYTVDAAWQPKKLEVLLDVPDTLDLTHLRANGLQPTEQAMPEDTSSPDTGAGAAGATVAAAPAEADEAVVMQLVSMGFNEHGCRRAALATGNNTEAAMEWVFAHMEDPDFNEPLQSPLMAAAADAAMPSSGAPPAPAAAAAAAAAADPESIMTLSSMGFSEAHASAALGACSGNMERAADWLFSHSDDLDGAVAQLSAAAGAGASSGSGGGGGGSTTAAPPVDGPGIYKLRAMVSHIGKTTGSGHYVCHALKPVGAEPGGAEKWVIFNDANVALSAQPPREHAYIYLYERV